ncbi:hypothetical protein B0T10DRAFT_558735 [Thelonectria olida]|uniref:Uncharacterized protein n=1 Tax=Thelonectria olida TaxID=1576542 RepID=A0A9P8WEE6_9HYPO|nr:hypothetical protein B0T10DRAFT_558735 [Thelonectria olida]
MAGEVPPGLARGCHDPPDDTGHNAYCNAQFEPRVQVFQPCQSAQQEVFTVARPHILTLKIPSGRNYDQHKASRPVPNEAGPLLDFIIESREAMDENSHAHSPNSDDDDHGLSSNFSELQIRDSLPDVASIAKETREERLSRAERTAAKALNHSSPVPSFHNLPCLVGNTSLPAVGASRPIVWEDLAFGVRWIIFKIIENDNHCFVKICMAMLRLTRPQVHEFLNMYTSEHQLWLVFEQRLKNTPWEHILERATSRNMSPTSLIGDERPVLLTDNVLNHSIDHGCVFLRAKGLDNYAADLERWKGSKLVDFLPLQIEREVIVDYFDNRSIQNAWDKGWIDLDAHYRRLMEMNQEPSPLRPEDEFMGAPSPPVLIREPSPPPEEPEIEFLGSFKNYTPVHRRRRTVSEALTPRTLHLNRPDRTSSPNSRSSNTWEGGPSTPEKIELQGALGRQFPGEFRCVGGDFTSTHVEENRTPTGFRRVIGPPPMNPPPEPEPPGPESLRPDTSKDENENPPKKGGQRKKAPAKPVQRKLAPASRQKRCPQLDDQAPAAEEQQAPTRSKKAASQKKDPAKKSTTTKKEVPKKKDAVSKKGTSASRDEVVQKPPGSGRAALTVRLPSLPPGPTTKAASSRTLPIIEDDDEPDELPPVPAISDPMSAGYNSIKAAARVHDYTVSGKRPWATKTIESEPPAAISSVAEKPVPPDELRNLLNANFGGHLKQPPANRAEMGQRGGKAHADSVHDNDEEEDIYGGPDDELNNAAYAEAEQDSDYQPKKGGRKKKLVVKKSGTSTRTPKKKKKNVSFEEQIEEPAVSCTERSTPKKTETQKKPRAQTRIKLPKLPRASPPTPSTPFSKSEPLFGIDRKTPLAGPLGRADRVFYAWSASQAKFAAVATRARFAERADRIVPCDTGSGEVSRQFEALRQLKEQFQTVESDSKAGAAQDADVAEFAGCADDAMYAAQADEAVFALSKGRRYDDGGRVGMSMADEDTPMPDAPSLV